MRKKLANSVNLLAPLQPPQDTFTILYNWVFSVGRVLLISIQVIVIIVFAVRLYMDRVNNDLTRNINDNIAFLSQPEIQEEQERYSRLQILFDDIERLKSNQPRNSDRIVAILDSVPGNIYLDEFSYRHENVQGKFIAYNFADIRSYENFLKQSPNYSDVRVVLERRGTAESEIEFEIVYSMSGEDEFE